MKPEPHFDEPAKRVNPWVPVLFAVLCAGYLAVRFLVIDSAVDHIHNDDMAEYQLVQHALFLMGKLESYPVNKHLWAHPATSWALVPFLKSGLTPTEAIRTLSTLISFLGFAALFWVLLIRAGIIHGLTFAILMIFPDATYLTWTMTLWGAHPEAASLVSVGVALWIVASTGGSAAWFAVAGLMLGLATAYSTSIIYVSLAVFLVTALLDKYPWRDRLRKVLPALGLGFAAGLSPFLIWYVTNVQGGVFEPRVFNTKTSMGFLDLVTFPTAASLQRLLRNLGRLKIFGNAFERILLFASLGWLAYATLGPGRRTREKWPLIIPAGFVVAFAILAVFAFPQAIGLRHILWFYIAGYLGISLLIGEGFSRAKKAARFAPRVALAALPMAALLYLSAVHVQSVSRLIQPAEMGMVKNFRGLDYYTGGFGLVMGKEIPFVNCYLDTVGYRRLRDPDYRYGFRKVFGFEDYAECCRWEPYDPWPGLFTPFTRKSVGNLDQFFQGVGCGYALKPTMGRAQLAALADEYGPEIGGSATRGFEECASLPCLTSVVSP